MMCRKQHYVALDGHEPTKSAASDRRHNGDSNFVI